MAARVVREALGAIASPTVATRVLHRALHLAGEHEIPAGGSRLRRFVERHLHGGAAFVLGADLADVLVEQLAPLVAPLPTIEPRPRGRALLELEAAGLVESGRELERDPFDPDGPLELSLDELEGSEESEGSRESSGAFDLSAVEPDLEGDPHPLGHRRTERAPSVPVVLLASQDECAVAAFRETLGKDAQVLGVADVVALLDAVQQHHADGTSVCIVIHGHSATVHPSTLATIAEDLPTDTAIALWGVAREARRDSMELADPRAWLLLPAELDGRAAADELRRMLGLPTSGIFAARPR